MSGGADGPVLAHGSAARRSKERRNAIFLLLAAAYLILFYALTNYYPLRQPRTLVSFGFESRIAMWPSTCWIYLSYFVLLLYTGLRLRRFEWTPRAACAIAAAVTLSGIAFLFYPTTMIRPPLHGTGISVEALRWLRALDPPNNCFPSMHVAMAFLCFLLLMVANRRTGILILPWAAAIAVSTLTTKQHYFLDIVGGLVVAGTSFAIFFVPIGRSRPILRRSGREIASAP
jgi:membrane-associated phospholipid phosphatase